MAVALGLWHGVRVSGTLRVPSPASGYPGGTPTMQGMVPGAGYIAAGVETGPPVRLRWPRERSAQRAVGARQRLSFSLAPKTRVPFFATPPTILETNLGAFRGSF